MPAAAYLFGRREVDLREALNSHGPVKDMLFSSQRLDSVQLQSATFEHCTFANISFKNCKVDMSAFSDCVFVDCYFRGTRITNSRFSASKFIDCDFTKIDIRATDFKYYNTFKGCWIPWRELFATLPHEPNLRSHLCANLADEARTAGALKDSERYRQAGATANEQHLRMAFLNSASFYKEKFPGVAQRAGAFLEYLGSKVRGYLWGYKRSYLVLLRNWAAITFLIFPLAFLSGLEGLGRENGHVEWTDVWLASLGSMLPGSEISPITYNSGFSQAVAFVEVFFSLLFGGLTFALLFRSIFERWR